MKDPIRILHLEDTERDAELVRDHLEASGLACQITLVRDQGGFEAALEGGPWDVILSDYTLRGYDGLAALKQSRAKYPLTPVIVLSGSISAEEAVECMRDGATDYLLKQRPERLASAVRRALDEVDEHQRRMQAELDLRENEERLRLAFAATQMETWNLDLKTNRVRISENAARLFGVGSPGLESELSAWLPYIHPADRERRQKAFDAALRDGAGYQVEYRMLLPDGVVLWTAVWGALVRDAEGRPARLIGVSQDITKRKAADAAMLSSLREKEALLKEVHHRVKNNLQVIASLLRLEARRIGDPATREVLDDMTNRIHSMALLHETLYRSGNLAEVALDAYLQQVAAHVLRSSVASPRAVELQVDLSPVHVTIDQAIPCGLIVNELAANSLKHGFPDGRGGVVRLEIHTLANTQQIRLRVSDTGVGLPADFEEKRARSLGLQLVSDLARQLQGRLVIGSGPAAVFEVTFEPAGAPAIPSAPGTL